MREQDKTNTSSEEETYTDSESDSESSPTSQQREETVFSTIEWESIEVHSFLSSTHIFPFLSSSYSLVYSTTLLFFTFPTLGCMKKDLWFSIYRDCIVNFGNKHFIGFFFHSSFSTSPFFVFVLVLQLLHYWIIWCSPSNHLFSISFMTITHNIEWWYIENDSIDSLVWLLSYSWSLSHTRYITICSSILCSIL